VRSSKWQRSSSPATIWEGEEEKRKRGGEGMIGEEKGKKEEREGERELLPCACDFLFNFLS
jgi:hypothetical protein